NHHIDVEGGDIALHDRNSHLCLTQFREDVVEPGLESRDPIASALGFAAFSQIEHSWIPALNSCCYPLGGFRHSCDNRVQQGHGAWPAIGIHDEINPARNIFDWDWPVERNCRPTHEREILHRIT